VLCQPTDRFLSACEHFSKKTSLGAIKNRPTLFANRPEVEMKSALKSSAVLRIRIRAADDFPLRISMIC